MTSRHPSTMFVATKTGSHQPSEASWQNLELAQVIGYENAPQENQGRASERLVRILHGNPESNCAPFFKAAKVNKGAVLRILRTLAFVFLHTCGKRTSNDPKEQPLDPLSEDFHNYGSSSV